MSYLDKKVQQYLTDWVDGKAVLNTGWHGAVLQGRTAGVTNNGLVNGRRKCEECGRYRCQHQLNSGGVAARQKLTLMNNKRAADKASVSGYRQGMLAETVGIKKGAHGRENSDYINRPVHFHMDSGHELIQAPQLKLDALSMVSEDMLPSGVGVTKVGIDLVGKTRMNYKRDKQKEQARQEMIKRRAKLEQPKKIVDPNGQVLWVKNKWVSPHVAIKMDEKSGATKKEPLAFMLNARQHYPYLNRPDTDVPEEDPDLAILNSLKRKQQKAQMLIEAGSRKIARKVDFSPQVQEN